MSHYYQDQIKSMVKLVDYRIQANLAKCREANEQPNVYDQDEMKTCDLPDGGPWLEDFKARGLYVDRA